jgi:AraC family transcriptional regulator of adaptative response/methylated-DNA-[protein]-cysteine methyltransferase
MHNGGMADWHLYLLRTRCGALYTGIATDVERRLAAHGKGRGAKSLRAKGPLSLVYQAALGERGAALRAEYAIKQLPKAMKEALVAAQPDTAALRARLGLECMQVADSAARDGVPRTRSGGTLGPPPPASPEPAMQTCQSIDAVTPSTDDERWAAVQRRDRTADGQFFYGVRTTGVFCRPSCPSRPARRENVSFHASCDAARHAGFRACKRCKPEQWVETGGPHAGVVRACRAIEGASELPTLDELARIAGLSRFHFHRQFRASTGVTPRAYAAARRSERLRAALGSGGTVTDAIYAAGYNSNARFYSDASGILGMTPGTWRAGGRDTEIRFAIGQCSLGAILVAATGKGLCAILLGDDPDQLARDLQDRFPHAALRGDDPAFASTVALVVGFVEAPAIGLDLPLDIRGTAFQQRVWQALREIPPGQTASYADVARKLGQPRAVRAVAQACGANALAVAIPCHRVVKSDGSLSGYHWGVQRKQALLEREAAC